VNDDPPLCLKFLPFRSYLPLLNLSKLLSTEQLLHVLKRYYLPFVSLCLYYQRVRRVVRILSINSLRPSVRDGVRVSRRPGPARPVLRVFFQKICGFRAGNSCSQSFLWKDLWFPSLGTGRPGRRIVYRGPKTQVTFKIVPLVPRAQKLFRTSITHFYFFTYRVPSLESRPIQVPSCNAQASKTRMIKKNLAWVGRRPGVWNRGSKY
jgi:hypothetical protein